MHLSLNCRVCHWLGRCPTTSPMPLPHVDLPRRLAEGAAPCMLLAHWMQVRPSLRARQGRRAPPMLAGGVAASACQCLPVPPLAML